MTTPPHPALSHLQITFTPDEYRLMLRKYSYGAKFRRSEAGPDYWERLPTYLVSRCPFSGHQFTAQLDTHSLAGWMTHPDLYQDVYDDDHQQIASPYVVAIHTFINLQGFLPDDQVYFSNAFDVPFILPYFLPDDIPSYVVLHSLPLCYLAGQTFEPRYSLSIITYYATEPALLRERRQAAERAWGGDDPEYRCVMLEPSSPLHPQSEVWDLRLWVRRKRLLWLDPASPNLPLRDGPAEDFPYADVQGYRQAFTVQQGKIRLCL